MNMIAKKITVVYSLQNMGSILSSSLCSKLLPIIITAWLLMHQIYKVCHQFVYFQFA